MSDTHDRLEIVDKIVEAFADVDAIMHCGDICSPFVARKLAAFEGKPFYAVRGNNDGDITFLNQVFAKLGPIKENAQILDIGNRKVFLLHGHAIPEEQITDIATAGKFDIIVYGHYHHVRNEIIGDRTLVLNPGESCGYLTGECTVMIVDLQEDGTNDVQILKL